MSDANETTTERKPPTLADIVREKTDDGRRIIDFFLDVMEDRIDGAELCHRIDAAKQLEKHKSRAAARFIAKHRGVSCGHSIRGRRDPADPCTAEERSLVAVTLNAPATLTQDFLTVLSGIDEFLMARLIRAQTADGDTIIEFLDDVMQDRNEGFKCHHRIAAAKELIVHIVRDEQPAPTPREPVPEQSGIPEKSGTHPAPSTTVVPAHTTVVPAEAGTHPAPDTIVVPAHTTVVPAEAGTHPRPNGIVTMGEPASEQPGAETQPPHPEHGERFEGPQLETPPARRPRTRRTRTQRRRDGAARAAILREGSERIEEEKDEKPAPVELTPAERRIREKLEAHRHERDPWTGPIDSTTPGRSPPW